MDATLKLWAVILVVGALNYLSRLSFIAFFARRTMPPMLARALRYVPAAMLTALVLPMVIDVTPQGLHPHTPKVIAAVIATVVAWFKLGTLWTLGVGMAALWLLNWTL
ncbi:MAG: AzlD domain-containing protein [Casimicrobiaceae bacterium]|jgi:branched-subunit amino acid transport protein